MSFLGRFFSREEEKKVEETRVLLKDVEDFVGDKIKKDFEPLSKPAKEEYANLQQVASTMQNQLKVLEEATYPERTYPALINRAVGNRKSFIGKMSFLIKQIQRPIEEDEESVLNFYEETNRLINITNLETTKEYAFLKILFEKEGREVVHSFRQLIDISNKLGDLLKAPRESSLKLPKIKKVVSEVSRLIEELKRSETDEIDKKLKEDESKIKETENELERLTHDNDWKRLLDMQKVAEEMKIRMRDKKSDFIEYMSKLEVPLKKYRWSVENKTLDEYLQKSFESILCDDPGGKVFRSILKDMKAEIIEGKMNLKDRDEFITIIENLIENNVIGKIIEDYSKLSEELKNQEEKISSQEVSKRKVKLENEMDRLKREIEMINNDKSEAIERIKRMQANKEQKIKELEDLLKDIYGKRISLGVK
jgi:hypothetical protein